MSVMSSDHHGKGYTPLPQSISNTDTEDEDERLTRSNDVHKECETTIPEATELHKNGVFRPLDETRNLAKRVKNGQSTLRYCRDDIPIMVIEGSSEHDLWSRRSMSPVRLFCLIVSVLVCFATIIVFLYVLPCDNSVVCPPIVEPMSAVSWDKTLQGVELHGPITVIPGSPNSLVFLLRGQRYGNNTYVGEQRQISPDGGGVMSIQGNTGLPLWLVPLKRLPTEIDCVSLDTDRSGKPDCIVSGDHGLLVSIDPIAGTIHWISTFHTSSKLPVIIPDIDSDGVEDLLSTELIDQSFIVLLSGRTGDLLGKYLVPSNCVSVDIYDLVQNGSISYICHDASGKRVERHMTLKGLFRAAKYSPNSRIVKKLLLKLVTSRLFETVKLNEEENVWKPTLKHRLSIENEGTCPGELCRVSVNLTLQKSNQTITIWDHVALNSFASQPAFLVVPGKRYVTGFAIKFWEWVNSTSEHMEKVSSVVERRLIERVFIIYVNYTDVQVINDSQSDVVQLCQGTDCQPNLSLQTRFSSVGITYISSDGFPELINYWSSYDIETSKLLTSKVQVIKLDSVIPNLL